MDIAINSVQNLKEENKRLKEENEKLLLIIENLSSNGKSGKYNNQRSKV